MLSSTDSKAIHTPLFKSLTVVICMIFAVSIQFRTQILTGFSTLYGDSYDATIVATILEHWFSVFHGSAHWSELNYFFPHKNTLGQTDAYFLAAVLYTPFRLLSIDPYLSSELANVSLRAIGFLSFYVLSVRMFRIGHYWSVVGAVLFVLSNNLTIHGQRLQLATVSLAPVMGMFLWCAYGALMSGDRKKLLAYGASSGILLGAWSITCFYITWFFIYFTTFFFLIGLIICGKFNRQILVNRAKENAGVLLAIIVITGLSLYPLLSVYLSKAAETGMRPYEGALSNTVTWQGILQTGNENFMFGQIYNKFLRLVSSGYAPSGEYYNTGISPILFFIFITSAALTLARKAINFQDQLWRGFTLATIITWVGVLNIGGHSAWYLLYSFFPGAKALNVVGAYQLFLSIPVILIATRYLQENSKLIPLPIATVLVALLGLEELNKGYTLLDRQVEINKTSLRIPPPQHCKVFYVSGWANQDTITPMAVWINNYYAHNVSAMLIAELNHLPTVNGVASFNPKDWNFGFPNNADYDQRVKAYTDSYGLQNVCKLNLVTQEWSSAW